MQLPRILARQTWQIDQTSGIIIQSWVQALHLVLQVLSAKNSVCNRVVLWSVGLLKIWIFGI